MESTNWLKQTDRPLFDDLLWSRPENKRTAGKLLIAGGNLHSFSAVSTAFGAAEKAGGGAVRALLPDALSKTVGKLFPEAEFAPSTASGSFARNALDQLIASAAWADGVLMAGDFGRNSETEIMLGKFMSKHVGSITLVGDVIDYFFSEGQVILNTSSNCVVADMSQLQKLMSGKVLIKHSMDLSQLVNSLQSANSQAAIVTLHSDQIVVAVQGRISTTPAKKCDLVNLAAYVSVWQIQQSGKIFEALTSAAYCYQQ